MNFQFACPVTNSDFFATVAITGQIVARYWGKKIELVCPLCSQQHRYDFKERYIAAAVTPRQQLMRISGC